MADPRAMAPLISPRSPSYSRAQRGVEDPGEADNAERIAILSRLVELEENARKVSDEEDAATHAARRDELGAMVSELGGSAPRPDECRSLLSAQDPAGIRAELRAAYLAAAGDARMDPAHSDALKQLAG